MTSDSTENTDNVRTVWTDEDLDAALAALYPTGGPHPADLAAAWSRVERETAPPNDIAVSTVDTKRRRPWLRWTAAAAVVAAAAAGIGIATQFQPSVPVANGPAGGERISTAALVLRDAGAAAIREHDQPVPAGQFRYIRSEGWTTTTAVLDRQAVNYQTEVVGQTWIPAAYTGVWTSTTTHTGQVRWIGDGAAEAAKLGIKPDRPGTTTQQAPCGDFLPSRGAPSCSDPIVAQGSWQHPNPAWLAGLPTDPRQLLDRLRRDAPHNNRGDGELFNYATDALSTGLLPANLRGALYQALALLPDVTITQRATTLDGRDGVAFAVDDPTGDQDRQEMVIDPATGDYIGGRDVALTTTGGIPAGTVLSSESVTTAVVPRAGATP